LEVSDLTSIFADSEELCAFTDTNNGRMADWADFVDRASLLSGALALDAGL
jgi:hypothetical protein